METRETQIDVVIISYAKNDKLKQVTMDGIQSLIASEDKIQFNIFVVESNPSMNYDHYPYTFTIYTDMPFSYHRYLNLGRRMGSSQYVVLCNSDLTYSKNWASQIISKMKLHPEILSASPFCPQTQNINEWNQADVHIGYIVRAHLAGWCIFQQRKIYEIIGELDERYKYWYSDNDYSQELIRHNICHALISRSIVNHHSGNHGETGKVVLQDAKLMDEYTNGQYEIFRKKWNL